jgi:hypothetical protein
VLNLLKRRFETLRLEISYPFLHLKACKESPVAPNMQMMAESAGATFPSIGERFACLSGYGLARLKRDFVQSGFELRSRRKKTLTRLAPPVKEHA